MRADIHDGQEHNVPFKGRIQKRKTFTSKSSLSVVKDFETSSSAN